MNDLLASPHEIERRSFQIIGEELGDRVLDPAEEPIIKRVIHTTADFSYVDSLVFANDAIERGKQAILAGATIVTDTNMALAGISKPGLARFGCQAKCFVADPEAAKMAQENGTTRSVASVNLAAQIEGPLIYAVGNAPTALLRLAQLIEEGTMKPDLIIGVPVGFVNVVESKERILECDVPCIVARGRKGGSNVAAAICNALLYSLTRTE